MASTAGNPSVANNESSWWRWTQSGWVEGPTHFDTAPPGGNFEFQYQNSFAGTATPPGAGWNTWSTVAKPAAAAYGAFSQYLYATPKTHTDTSVAGGTAQNYGYAQYYSFFGTGTWYSTYTYTTATAKPAAKADDPTIAMTQIADPSTVTNPGTGDWTVGSEFVQLGSFNTALADNNLLDSATITLQPASQGGTPVTYNLLTVQLNADGTALITTDLNNNNAFETGDLVSGLNGVLLLNGVVVTVAQATRALEGFYTPKTGWNLNPQNQDVSLVNPGNPSAFDKVFNLETDVFLDGTTSSSVVSNTDAATAVATSAAPCFCAGTAIATDGGDVPVERLRIGDRVLTRSGAFRPIKWIGRRSYRRPLPDGADIIPVTIRAGAIADSVPLRDLTVSPLHAMLIDGVLVPAGELLNGLSVVRAACDTVDYFHIELDRHDIIFAESAATETFVDCDSRMMFANAVEFAALYPADTSPVWQFCAPRVDGGTTLRRIWRDVAVRAGWRAPQSDDSALPPVDGQVDGVEPGAVWGWAWMPDCPGERVEVVVLDNGGALARIRADIFEPGLLRAGIGDGRHHFHLNFNPPLASGEPHLIEVRRAEDGAALRSSSALLRQPAALAA